MNVRWGIAIVWVLLASGCASPGSDVLPEQVLLQTVVAGVPRDNPQTVLLALDQSIQDQLDARIDRDWGDIRKSTQLSQFLFEELGIQYEPRISKTAASTFHTRLGNCLAISSLFVASARYLDIDGHFEIVEVDPNWARENDMMIRYEHIVASGDVGIKSFVIDILRPFRDQDSVRTDITDEQALALYYSNQAVDALMQQDLDVSLDWLRRAVRLWPDNTNIWNNLATVYRRQGDSRLAEASYQRSLSLDRFNYSALANLTRFYVLENRVDEADQYMQRVERYYRRNPFYRVQLARVQVEQGELKRARRNLDRASRLQPGDPALHELLAESYALIGDSVEADRQMALAREARERFQPQLMSGS